ncbi:hypothetical protein AgCh_018269 [Apium graveolens]
MERLIRAAEGPSLSREFDELLKALKASLNNNHFTYKKAMDKTINFLRVIMVNQDNFQQKRIVLNTNDSVIDRYTLLLTELKNAQVAAFPEIYLQPSKGMSYICPNTKHFNHFYIPKTQINKNDLDDDKQKKDDQNPSGSNPSQSSKPSGSKGGEKKKDDDKKDEEKKRRVLAEWLIERQETKKRNEAEAEEGRRKYDEEIKMYIKRSEELKAKGMSRISKDGKFLNIKAGGFSRFRIDLLDSGYPKVAIQKLVEALSGTPKIEEHEILDHLKDLLREEADTKTVFT